MNVYASFRLQNWPARRLTISLYYNNRNNGLAINDIIID